MILILDPSVDHVHPSITESITREAIQYLMTEGLYDDGKVTDNIQRVRFVSSDDDEKDTHDSLKEVPIEEETLTPELAKASQDDMPLRSKILLGFGTGIVAVLLGGFFYKQCRRVFKHNAHETDKDGDYDHGGHDHTEEGEYDAARRSSTNLVIHNKIIGNVVTLDKNFGPKDNDDLAPFDKTAVAPRESYDVGDEEHNSVLTISTLRDAEILSIDVASSDDADSIHIY
jgi:hypothetical protein